MQSTLRIRFIFPLLLLLLGGSVQAQTVISMSPDSGENGQTLTTSITTSGMFFSGATFDIELQHVGSPAFSISSDPSSPGISLNDDDGVIDFFIPITAPAGLYNLFVTTLDFDGNAFTEMLANAFTVSEPDAIITGHVYYDANGNGVEDAGDFPLANQKINLAPDGVLALTDANGNFYYAGVYETSYTVSIIPQAGWTQTSSPTNYSFMLTSDQTNLNFGLQGPPPYVEMLTSISTTAPTCNQLRSYTMSIKNKGTGATQTGYVQYIKPSSATYINSSPIADVISGDTLTWNYTVLEPLTWDYYSVTLHLPVTAGVTLNHSLTAYGENSTIASADTASTTATQTVTCSYDPNDKSANVDTVEVTGTSIDYVVRFQNTGNDTAYTVIVRDTLSALLDINTFELIGADHEVNVQLHPSSNSIAFIFDNILLVDSGTNEPASHGTFAYRISTLNSMAPGSDIHNTASIYFDFNDPVVTNDALVVYCNKDTLETQDMQICTGDSIEINGVWYSEAGTYGYHTSSPTVCDVLNMINLTLALFPDATVIQQGNGLLAPPNAASYQWIDCSDSSEIVGATSEAYFPPASGSYAVIVSNAAGCVTKSECFVVTGVADVAAVSFSVSPNPANEVVKVTYNAHAGDLLQLVDLTGKLVASVPMQHAQTSMPLNNVASGMYMLRVKSNSKIIGLNKLAVLK